MYLADVRSGVEKNLCPPKLVLRHRREFYGGRQCGVRDSFADQRDKRFQEVLGQTFLLLHGATDGRTIGLGLQSDGRSPPAPCQAAKTTPAVVSRRGLLGLDRAGHRAVGLSALAQSQSAPPTGLVWYCT